MEVYELIEDKMKKVTDELDEVFKLSMLVKESYEVDTFDFRILIVLYGIKKIIQRIGNLLSDFSKVKIKEYVKEIIDTIESEDVR